MKDEIQRLSKSQRRKDIQGIVIERMNNHEDGLELGVDVMLTISVY